MRHRTLLQMLRDTIMISLLRASLLHASAGKPAALDGDVLMRVDVLTRLA